MIAYLDASVILRIILGQPGKLAEWHQIETGICSALAEVECLRAVDRLLVLGEMELEQAAARRASIFELLQRVVVVEVTRAILSRASQSFPTPLGTLDAIHLATALSWRDQNEASMTLATHDQALGLAARASGLKVLGTS